MDFAEHLHEPEARPRRRGSARYEVQCRARIVIAKRHYAGYIHNISKGGAKLRTITPIRKLGAVLLRVPDMPPIRCQIRWTDSHNAGVEFEPALSCAALLRWIATRSAVSPPSDFAQCEISSVNDAVQHPQPAPSGAIDAALPGSERHSPHCPGTEIGLRFAARDPKSQVIVNV